MGLAGSKGLAVPAKQAHTLLGREAVAYLEQGFRRLCGRGRDALGPMSRQVFVRDVLQPAYPNIPTQLANRIFYALDVEEVGELQFEQFLCALAVLTRGTLAQQMQLFGALFDLDRNGVLTRDIMSRFLRAIYGRRYAASPRCTALLSWLFYGTGTRALTLAEFAELLGALPPGASRTLISTNPREEAEAAREARALLFDWLRAPPPAAAGSRRAGDAGSVLGVVSRALAPTARLDPRLLVLEQRYDPATARAGLAAEHGMPFSLVELATVQGHFTTLAALGVEKGLDGQALELQADGARAPPARAATARAEWSRTEGVARSARNGGQAALRLGLRALGAIFVLPAEEPEPASADEGAGVGALLLGIARRRRPAALRVCEDAALLRHIVRHPAPPLLFATVGAAAGAGAGHSAGASDAGDAPAGGAHGISFRSLARWLAVTCRYAFDGGRTGDVAGGTAGGHAGFAQELSPSASLCADFVFAAFDVDEDGALCAQEWAAMHECFGTAVPPLPAVASRSGEQLTRAAFRSYTARGRGGMALLARLRRLGAAASLRLGLRPSCVIVERNLLLLFCCTPSGASATQQGGAGSFGTVGSTWCVVSLPWLAQWCRFVGFGFAPNGRVVPPCEWQGISPFLQRPTESALQGATNDATGGESRGLTPAKRKLAVEMNAEPAEGQSYPVSLPTEPYLDLQPLTLGVEIIGGDSGGSSQVSLPTPRYLSPRLEVVVSAQVSIAALAATITHARPGTFRFSSSESDVAAVADDDRDSDFPDEKVRGGSFLSLNNARIWVYEWGTTGAHGNLGGSRQIQLQRRRLLRYPLDADTEQETDDSDAESTLADLGVGDGATILLEFISGDDSAWALSDVEEEEEDEDELEDKDGSEHSGDETGDVETGAGPSDIAQGSPEQKDMTDCVAEDGAGDTRSDAMVCTPTPPRRKRKRQRQGLVGLRNLGNTCFMASAVQCLCHTPLLTQYFLEGYWRADLNRTSLLGAGGHMAEAFARLLVDIWRTSQPDVSPRAFKSAVSRYSPQFAGSEQHDAHEFVTALLNNLGEDLNRVKKKPYVEQPDSNGRPDSELADEWWRNHLRRELSVITALFTGQFKQRLTCCSCGFESVRFEPFQDMELQLPQPTARTVEAMVVFIDAASQPALRCSVRVPMNATVGDVTLALVTMLRGEREMENEGMDGTEDWKEDGATPGTSERGLGSGTKDSISPQAFPAVAPSLRAKDLIAVSVMQHAIIGQQPPARPVSTAMRGGHTSLLFYELDPVESLLPVELCSSTDHSAEDESGSESERESADGSNEADDAAEKEDAGGGGEAEEKRGADEKGMDVDDETGEVDVDAARDEDEDEDEDGDASEDDDGDEGRDEHEGDENTEDEDDADDSTQASDTSRDPHTRPPLPPPFKAHRNRTQLVCVAQRRVKAAAPPPPADGVSASASAGAGVGAGSNTVMGAGSPIAFGVPYFTNRFHLELFGEPLLLRLPLPAYDAKGALQFKGATGRQVYEAVWRRVSPHLRRAGLNGKLPSMPSHRSDGAQGNRGGENSEGAGVAPADSSPPRVPLQRMGSHGRYDLWTPIPLQTSCTGDLSTIALGYPGYPVFDTIEGEVNRRGGHPPRDDAPVAEASESMLFPPHPGWGFAIRRVERASYDGQAISSKLHPSLRVNMLRDKQAVSLDACLRAFTREEKVPDTYCSRCKELRDCRIHMQVWRLPPVLVVHLKRFYFQVEGGEGGNVRQHKLSSLVRFPLTGLDLSPFTARASAAAQAVAAAAPAPNDATQATEAGAAAAAAVEEEGDEDTEPEDDDMREPSNDDGEADETQEGGKDIAESDAENVGGNGGGDADDEREGENEDEDEEAVIVEGGVLDRGEGRKNKGYNLYGVVNHFGALGAGHYVASAKSEHDGRWHCFNDHHCRTLNASEVLTSHAYMLFYIREDMEGIDISDVFPPNPRGSDADVREEDIEQMMQQRDTGRCVIS
eukprot:g1671.t1